MLKVLAGPDGIEPSSKVLSQKYLAGVSGLEPEMEVLETSVIPFHHTPKNNACLELRDPVHLSKTLQVLQDGTGRDLYSTGKLRPFVLLSSSIIFQRGI